MAEGKGKRGAFRVLKTYIARVMYHHLSSLALFSSTSLCLLTYKALPEPRFDIYPTPEVEPKRERGSNRCPSLPVLRTSSNGRVRIAAG